VTVYSHALDSGYCFQCCLARKPAVSAARLHAVSVLVMRDTTPTRLQRQRGQSLLETAMMIVVIFTVVFWIFELGWVMYTYSVMADAANEGARYAIVHSGGDVGGTTARVNTFAGTSLHDIRALSVSVTFPDGSAAPPNRVRVTVTYTYVPWLKQFITAPTMRTYAEGRMITQ
jgi:Flp pilus assembly protein TadG